MFSVHWWSPVAQNPLRPSGLLRSGIRQQKSSARRQNRRFSGAFDGGSRRPPAHRTAPNPVHNLIRQPSDGVRTQLPACGEVAAPLETPKTGPGQPRETDDVGGSEDARFGRRWRLRSLVVMATRGITSDCVVCHAVPFRWLDGIRRCCDQTCDHAHCDEGTPSLAATPRLQRRSVRSSSRHQAGVRGMDATA